MKHQISVQRRKHRRLCSARKRDEILEFQKGTTARNDYDAVCVLGGGYEEDGVLPPWVHHRLQLSHDLLSLQSPSCPVLCVGGGTPHRPPVLTPTGYLLHESTLLAQQLIGNGVPAGRILKETASYDTVGNAYFVLTIHAIPSQWRKLAIITSGFHMARASTLFKDIFHLASKEWDQTNHDKFNCDNFRYNLEFFAAQDEHTLAPEVLAARCEREAESLEKWKQNLTELKSLSDVHRWLHHTHLCYSVSRQHEFGASDLNSIHLSSY